MSWFKVDDSFYDHPKVADLDMSARGLWVTAGSYCGRHSTDGVISERQIRALGGTRTQAAKLVDAGLWSVARDDGDDAASGRRYVFNDWLDYQPSREATTARRQQDAERKRAMRAARRSEQDKGQNVRTDVPTDVQPDVRGTHPPPVRTESALPDPTRPGPDPSSGYDSGAASVSHRARDTGPRCTRHADDPHPPPCGACADARRVAAGTAPRWLSTTTTPTPPPVEDLIAVQGKGSSESARAAAREAFASRKAATG